MKCSDFHKAVKKSIPDIVVCAGDETFFMEEALQSLKSAMDKKGQSFAISNVEAAQGEKDAAVGSRLLRNLATPVLFGDKTLYVVRSGDKILKAVTKELDALLEKNRALPHRVIFFVKKLDGRTKLAKRLQEADGYVECKRLYDTPAFWKRGGSDETELDKWAKEQAARHGFELDMKAAQFLTALTGNDLFAINSELEKLNLSLGSGDKKSKKKVVLDVEAIERSTGMSAVHTPFDLWEKIENHDTAGAMETLQIIIRNGMRSTGGRLETDVTAIANILMSMFRERVRLASQVALLVWERLQDKEIQAELKISSAFYLKKLKASAAKLTADSLKEMNAAMLTAERRIKREGLQTRPVLEELVISLSRAGKATTRGKAAGAGKVARGGR